MPKLSRSTMSDADTSDRAWPIERRLRSVPKKWIGTDLEAAYWLCHDAAAEIEAWRASAQRANEAAHAAMKLVSEYAYKAGFCEGGYHAILAGHADPRAVAKSCLDRFDDSGGTTQQTAAKPRKTPKRKKKSTEWSRP